MASVTLPSSHPGSSPKDKRSTKSGITTTNDGERHVPSSVRPDGSVRKEIRVRPGYKPPEDVELYKNRTAATWKNRGTGGVIGAEFVESEPKAAAETSRRKRRGGQSKEHKSTGDGEVLGEKKVNGASEEKEDEEPPDPEVQKEKEARKLSKKLRQAKDLEKKKADGSSLLPEQFEKVIKINELMRQLEGLGFDQEGNKKT